MKINVAVYGLDELKRKLKDDVLFGEASRIMLDHIAGRIAATGSERAPGRFKGKVKHRVSRRVPPRSAVVRIYHPAARFVHGPVKPGPARSKPHRPPLTPALKDWAARHGIPAGAVAVSVARRGTPFQPFLREAIEMNQGAAAEGIRKAEAEVKRVWDA